MAANPLFKVIDELTTPANLATIATEIGGGQRKGHSETALRIIRKGYDLDEATRNEVGALKEIILFDLPKIIRKAPFTALIKKIKVLLDILFTKANSRKQIVTWMHSEPKYKHDWQSKIVRDHIFMAKNVKDELAFIQNAKVIQRNENPKLVDAVDYLARVAIWKESKDESMKILYLLAVTGRRLIEIFTAQYQLAGHNIRWSRLAKKTANQKDQVIDAPVLPCCVATNVDVAPAERLAITADAIRRLDAVRTENKDLLKRTNAEISNHWDSKLNRKLASEFKVVVADADQDNTIKVHTLRAIYANLMYLIEPQGMIANVYFRRILGHVSLHTQESYTPIKFTRLPETISAGYRHAPTPLVNVANENDIKRVVDGMIKLQLAPKPCPLEVPTSRMRDLIEYEQKNGAQSVKQLLEAGFGNSTITRYRQWARAAKPVAAAV